MGFIFFQAWIQSKLWNLSKDYIDFERENAWFKKAVALILKYWKKYFAPNLGYVFLVITVIAILGVIYQISIDCRAGMGYNNGSSKTPPLPEGWTKTGLPIYASQSKDKVPLSDLICMEDDKAIPEIVEFNEGKTKTFTSGGIGNSKGLNFSIKFPESYTAYEGSGTNVVQKFSGSNFNCDVKLIVIKLPKALTLADKLNYLSEDRLQAMAQQAGMELVASRTELKAAGEMAAYVEVYNEAEQNGLKFRMYSRLYYILTSNYLVQVNFDVGDGHITKNELRGRFNCYGPLFTKMINSFVLNSKYDFSDIPVNR